MILLIVKGAVLYPKYISVGLKTVVEVVYLSDIATTKAEAEKLIE